MAGTRLELTWVGKEERPRLEARILLEDREKGHHAAARRSDSDIFDNMLIHGDNLLALKALEQDFRGKVKCVYIDPPYNTGSAFEHYDDGIEHSLWLSLMRDRLELLKTLLSEDGSIWISIDDNEMAYLKILCDEIFGRQNYINTISWQRKYSVSNNYKGIASICDYILIFRKSEKFKNNLLPRTSESISRYTNPDNDPRGPWKAVDYLNQAPPHKRKNLCYDIVNPNTGLIIKNTSKAWKYDINTHQKHINENRLWWGIDGKNTMPALKLFLSEVKNGMTPHDFWSYSEVGHTDEAKKENILLFGSTNIFDTPKPERLIQRILHIATKPGDLVLDSFLGSGTTAAVAHKMGRRWIGVELGEHCYTHCLPRLKKVVDGEDPGGISRAVNWEGGGGFRFYELGPTLIKKDSWGMEIINPRFNAEMLAEAMCRLMGYRYAPDPELYWKQGQATEQSFLYVTTQFLSVEALNRLALDAGENNLLVCCGGSAEGAELPPNLTVRKIPQAVLDKCEWDHDDYSLEIRNLPMLEHVLSEEETPEADAASAGAQEKKDGGRRRKKDAPGPSQGSLL